MNAARRPVVDVVVLDNPWLESKPLATVSSSRMTPRRASWIDSRRCSSFAAAAIATLIHVLAIGPLVLGSGSHRVRPPPAEGLPASGLKGEPSDIVSTYIVVHDTSIHSDDSPESAAATLLEKIESSLRDAPLRSSVDVPLAPSLGDLEPAFEPTSISADAAGDAGQAAMLFGRYMGQIKARIERAWTTPADAKTDRFSCRAQIRQLRDGGVQEVTLQSCDMDPRWQVSLVQAIQFASPLSAPPSEKLFTDVVTLNFERHKAR